MSRPNADFVDTDTDKSANWKIFNWRFHCEVPYIHTLTPADLKIGGIVVSGDRDIDLAMTKQKIQTYIPISEIAEYHSKGVQVRLMNAERSVIIYELILQHLNDWINHIQFSLNSSDIPVEDLEMLDALAVEVWKVARHYIRNSKEVATTPLFRKLRDINRGTATGRRRMLRSQIDETHNVPSEHKPLSAAFSKGVSSTVSKRPWQ